jgi:5-methylcytosine-specific restriction endonuclease McrA
MIRDNWTCRECGEPATEVAHLTYERFGEERDEDVVASCKECNQEERTRRFLKRK